MRRLAWLVGVVLVACAPAAVDVRVVGWNVETVGTPGSSQFDAARQVLERLDADVVAFNEINGAEDAQNLIELAERTGYPFVVQAARAPFGPLRTGIISRLPVTSSRIADAAELSGDPAANDLTRLVVLVTVEVPDALPLTVLTVHAKSGSGADDRFRRVVEMRRVAQALAPFDPSTAAYVVVGDVNEEVEDREPVPDRLRAAPPGLPGAFVIGADIRAALADGLPVDPFLPLEADPDLHLVDAPQTGTVDVYGTRPASGRRLDYGFVSPILSADVQGEAFAGDRPGAIGAVTSDTLAAAADHLPIVLDLHVPPKCTFDRNCPTGLCIEGRCVGP